MRVSVYLLVVVTVYGMASPAVYGRRPSHHDSRRPSKPRNPRFGPVPTPPNGAPVKLADKRKSHTSEPRNPRFGPVPTPPDGAPVKLAVGGDWLKLMLEHGGTGSRSGSDDTRSGSGTDSGTGSFESYSRSEYSGSSW